MFFDNFNYTVGRDDSAAESIFRSHGWNGCKTRQSGGRGNGYLYTVDAIPGYSGSFPGDNSSRVLAMVALPDSLGAQTDFYLEYGDGENPAYTNETIPGNVWFQFWIYINNAAGEPSRIDSSNKFIYPCNTAYPCHTEKWIMGIGSTSYLPYNQSLGNPSNAGAFLHDYAGIDVNDITNINAPSGDAYSIGQTDTSAHMAANRWTLVKIHLDTSTQSGKYEAWMRPQGGSWVKVAEWIDGVTQGFTWRVHADQVGGHRVIRMPTTIGRANPALPNYDAWIYMDDFAMARSEDGLPRY